MQEHNVNTTSGIQLPTNSTETINVEPKNKIVQLNREDRRTLNKITQSKRLRYLDPKTLTLEKLADLAGPKYAKFFYSLIKKAK